MKGVQKELKDSVNLATQVMRVFLDNALSQVKLFCSKVKIPRETIDAKKEIMKEKLISPEDRIFLFFNHIVRTRF